MTGQDLQDSPGQNFSNETNPNQIRPSNSIPNESASPETLPAPSLETQDLPPDQRDDDPESVLMSGPMHEAFLEVHQADPVPNAIVEKQPPEPINELPPEFKPDGLNVQWIPGYWGWDFDKADFVWVSGVWRDVPPDRQWIPGYWYQVDQGYRWISGYWQVESQESIDYLPEPPVSIDSGPSTPAPGDDYFYVPGNWVMQDTVYRWSPGYWQPNVANWVWNPARYIWSPQGCIYRAGYWDHIIDRRGVLFAPIHYSRPYYRGVGYRLTPRYVINVGLRLLPHLFVNLRHGHYYYGDWYAHGFRRHGVYPWVNAHRHHRRYYDPLQIYYSSPSQRHQNRNAYHWARDHHHHITLHTHLRPSRHFGTVTAHRKTSVNNHSHHRTQSIGLRYSDYVKQNGRRGTDTALTNGRLDPNRSHKSFRHLSKNDVQNELNRARPIQTIRLARHAHEIGKNKGSALVNGRGKERTQRSKLKIDSILKPAKQGIAKSQKANDAFRFSGQRRPADSANPSRNSTTLAGRNRSGTNSTKGSRASSRNSSDLARTGRNKNSGTSQGANLGTSPRASKGQNSSNILAPRSSADLGGSLRKNDYLAPRRQSSSSDQKPQTQRDLSNPTRKLTNGSSQNFQQRQSGRITPQKPLSQSANRTGSSQSNLPGTTRNNSSVQRQSTPRQNILQDQARRQIEDSRRATSRTTLDAQRRSDSARRLIDFQRTRTTPAKQNSSSKPASSGSIFNRPAGQRSIPQRSVPQRSANQNSSASRTFTPRSATQRSTTQRSTIQRPTTQRSTIQRPTTQRSTTQRSTIQRSTTQRSGSFSTGRGRSFGKSRRK